MTLIVDTVYNILARKLRGFQNCDAPKIFRLFVKGKANITVKNGENTVTYPPEHIPITLSLAMVLASFHFGDSKCRTIAGNQAPGGYTT
jgi:hypothetical protein